MMMFNAAKGQAEVIMTYTAAERCNDVQDHDVDEQS